MTVVSAKEMLMEATQQHYAVGAFNVTDLVQMEAVVEAHIERKAPLIVQTSVSPSKFLGREVLVAIYRTLASSAPIPICLHLDHCTEVAYCKACAQSGYTNIMIDASKESFEENIRQAREVVDYCHQMGDITVEAELGTVAGVEDQIKVVEDQAALCQPEQALEFVERTGVDLFAPAIGTAHGVYKTKEPKIDFERFEKISQEINGSGVRTPLVIHGGTGLPAEYVKRLVALGGAKLNVSTELKHALIDATYEYIDPHRDEYKPEKISAAVKEATRKVVLNWIDVLGSAGKA